MTAILDKAATDKLITSIKGRGAKLDADIHQAALSALSHHEAHGDVTLANRLVLAMPKSGRRAALIDWMVAFDPKLIVNPNRAEGKVDPLVHQKGNGAFDVNAADEKPFWDFTKDVSAYRQFDLNEAIEALLKRAETALANANQDTSKVQPDRLAALRAIAHPVANDATVEEQAA